MANGNVLKRRGGWWARVWYTDPYTGKKRDLQRRARTKAEAQDLLRQMLAEVGIGGESSLVLSKTKFSAFAEGFQQTELVPPEFRDGKKVSGLRSWEDCRRRLKYLLRFFGDLRLCDIRYAHLEGYSRHRLGTAKARGGDRKPATVHRELALLRRVLNVAVRDGWLTRNPFSQGRSLISAATENERQRILTREEEERLLVACEGPRKGSLRAMIILALDTGLRRGEILSLRWSDVDLFGRSITIRAFNCKTERERKVPMTGRVRAELMALPGKSADALVFGISCSVKKSFSSAREAAGLPDVRFHDLRHTAATRLARGGMSLPEVARILGHRQLSTTYRYVNADAETITKAADILGGYGVPEEARESQKDTT